MSESLLTLRFKEFLNLKYRGKLRAFTTDLRIPHTAFYTKFVAGKLVLEQYMIDRIANRWKDIDTDYIQKGTGILSDGSDNSVYEKPSKKKTPKQKEQNDADMSLLKSEIITSKDDVISHQRTIILKTEEVVRCKEEIIKRDAEIKKVLYEYNTYLKDSGRAR